MTTTHMAPLRSGGLTGCCGCPVTVLRETDQVTSRVNLVTCVEPRRALTSRYHCLHRARPPAGIEHDSGNGVAPRQKCSGCGGRFVTEYGLWGVFIYTDSGQYPAVNALATRRSEVRAQAWADRENVTLLITAPFGTSEHVVRWIPEGALK
jgi:hypothetical protein